AGPGLSGRRRTRRSAPEKARDGRGRFLELPETFCPEGASAQERLRQLQESPPLGTSRAAGGVRHAERSCGDPESPGPPSPSTPADGSYNRLMAARIERVAWLLLSV